MQVAAEADSLSSIVELVRSIRGQAGDAASLATTGAAILRLVEPVLEALVPPQVRSRQTLYPV